MACQSPPIVFQMSSSPYGRGIQKKINLQETLLKLQYDFLWDPRWSSGLERHSLDLVHLGLGGQLIESHHFLHSFAKSEANPVMRNGLCKRSLVWEQLQGEVKILSNTLFTSNGEQNLGKLKVLLIHPNFLLLTCAHKEVAVVIRLQTHEIVVLSKPQKRKIS